MDHPAPHPRIASARKPLFASSLDWVLEFDIKGLFDNLPHDLLMKAVRKHVKCKWALIYIERWLTAPMEKDCLRIERNLGVPQGGVISPILSNLFLHYAFDLWMGRAHPGLPWCRYADDGLVHCRSEQEAETLKVELQARFAECGLEMHPTKTKIAYCKDSRRKGSYSPLVAGRGPRSLSSGKASAHYRCWRRQQWFTRASLETRVAKTRR